MTSPNVMATTAAAVEFRRRNIKPRPPAITLSDHAKEKYVIGKERALTEHKLTLRTGSAGPKTGTRDLAPKTKLLYNKQLDQLKSFLTLIGDYESLLLLDDKAPENCISMNVESLVQYMQFKQNPKTETLKNLATEDVIDVNGNVIYCQVLSL